MYCSIYLFVLGQYSVVDRFLCLAQYEVPRRVFVEPQAVYVTATLGTSYHAFQWSTKISTTVVVADSAVETVYVTFEQSLILTTTK